MFKYHCWLLAIGLTALLLGSLWLAGPTVHAHYLPTTTLPISATMEQAETWHDAPPEQSAKFTALFHDFETWELTVPHRLPTVAS